MKNSFTNESHLISGIFWNVLAWYCFYGNIWWYNFSAWFLHFLALYLSLFKTRGAMFLILWKPGPNRGVKVKAWQGPKLEKIGPDQPLPSASGTGKRHSGLARALKISIGSSGNPANEVGSIAWKHHHRSLSRTFHLLPICLTSLPLGSSKLSRWRKDFGVVSQSVVLKGLKGHPTTFVISQILTIIMECVTAMD